MKKKLLKWIASMFLCSTVALGVSACGGTESSSSSENKNTSSIVSSIESSSVEESSSIEESSSAENSNSEDVQENKLLFKTLSVNDTEVSGVVSNATAEFSFKDEVQTRGESKFVVSSDQYGSQTYVTKIVSLVEGDNIFYVFETLEDEIVRTYTVQLRRRPTYTVEFAYNSGHPYITETIEPQTVEEGFYATQPQEPPSRIACDFVGWDYDFTTPITQSIIIDALWEEKDSMADFYFYSNSSVCILKGVKDKTVKEIVIPDGVTEIADEAFSAGYHQELMNLTSVIIPDSVTKIGWRAFYYCLNLTSVTIGSSVSIIDAEAFYYCRALKSVYIKDIEAWCNIEFGDRKATPLFYSADLYLKDELVTELTIPNSVTKINNYAFLGCGSITSINLPNSVTEIGRDAFDCRSLASIAYNGTMAEWKAIDKGDDWNQNILVTYVQCTDGKVDLT